MSGALAGRHWSGRSCAGAVAYAPRSTLATDRLSRIAPERTNTPTPVKVLRYQSLGRCVGGLVGRVVSKSSSAGGAQAVRHLHAVVSSHPGDGRRFRTPSTDGNQQERLTLHRPNRTPSTKLSVWKVARMAGIQLPTDNPT